MQKLGRTPVMTLFRMMLSRVAAGRPAVIAEINSTAQRVGLVGQGSALCGDWLSAALRQVHVGEVIVFDEIVIADQKDSAISESLNGVVRNSDVGGRHVGIVIAEQNAKVQSNPLRGPRPAH